MSHNQLHSPLSSDKIDELAVDVADSLGYSPRIVRLFHQNLVGNEGDYETLSTVINGVTIRVTLGDISASLHSRVVPGRILCPSAVTFGEIVSGMCVRGSFWPPLVAHSPCFSTDAHFICELKAKAFTNNEEQNGSLLEALYVFH